MANASRNFTLMQSYCFSLRNSDFSGECANQDADHRALIARPHAVNSTRIRRAAEIHFIRAKATSHVAFTALIRSQRGL
jgi:hypothetical protein